VCVVLCLSSKAQHPLYSLMKAQENADFDMVSYQNIFFEGLRLKTLGDFQGATNRFMSCLSMNGKDAAVMYEVAFIKMSAERYDEALFFIESACEIEPDNKWYQQLLASAYLENQNYVKAAKTFQKLLVLEPNNQDWHFELATAYLLNGQFKKAINSYNNLEKIVGPNELLIQQKKNIYLEMGNQKGAIEEVTKWLEIDSNNLAALNELSQLYILIGDNQGELQTLERILEIDPNNGKALLILSDNYRSNNQFDKAFSTTKKAFASTSLSIDSKMRILLAYYDMGTDSALLSQVFELVDVLIQTHPEDSKPYTIAGDYFYRSKQNKKAAQNFEKAIELDPSRFPIWQQLMIIYFDFQNYERVVSLADSSLELFPSQPTIYYFSGLANMQLENYNSAIEMLEMGTYFIVANDELKVQFYSALGDANHAQENHQESDKAYQRALALDSDNTYVLNNFSYYLSLRSSQLELALEMMERCNRLEPGVASNQDTYAWVYFQLKDYDNALVWLQKALENGGDSSSTIVEHYGDVLFLLGQEDKAVDQWKLAKELGSDSGLLNKKIEKQSYYE